jgi:hypothetical protein
MAHHILLKGSNVKTLLSVGIISAPRRKYYLGQSLDSYFSHWDIPPHVFAEPDTPTKFLHHSRVIWHQNKFKKNAVSNWADCLKWLWENTDSEFIMICEDDIEWRPGSSVELRSILLNGRVRLEDGDTVNLHKVGFISPYCSEKNQWDLGEREVWTKPRHGSNWMGALSICMPRATVERFLYHLNDFFFYSAWKAKENTYLHLDHAVGMTVGNSLKLPIITHNPTYVLHLGEHSTFPSNNDLGRCIPSSRLPAL